jgi:hypothetical protein
MMNTGIFADFMSVVDAIQDLVFNSANSTAPRSVPGGPMFYPNNPNNPQSLHHFGDENQLESWLMSPNNGQPLSIEEEVRAVLETINIFLPEIILDRPSPAANGGSANNNSGQQAQQSQAGPPQQEI